MPFHPFSLFLLYIFSLCRFINKCNQTSGHQFNPKQWQVMCLYLTIIMANTQAMTLLQAVRHLPSYQCLHLYNQGKKSSPLFLFECTSCIFMTRYFVWERERRINIGELIHLHSILSMSQPETPRPESPSSLPPVPSNASLPNNKMIGQPSMPSRSSSYTTTFHSIPYSNPGPIRRRRTDSFFSFETGPTFTETRQHYDLCSLDQTNK